MNRLAGLIALMSLAVLVGAQDAPSRLPAAPSHPVSTAYFGVKVTDPYRYMQNLADPAVRAWVEGQDRYARAVLDRIPGRARLLAELRNIEESDPVRMGPVMVLPGERYFYLEQARGRDSYSLYRRTGTSGRQVLLVDPAAAGSAGAGAAAIRFFSPSFDSRYVAYGISSGETEDVTLRVLDTETGKLLPDTIAGVGPAVAVWLPDGHSFLYSRMGKPAAGLAARSGGRNGRIYLHRLGTDAAGDVQVFGPGKTEKGPLPGGGVASIETAPGSSYVVAALHNRVDGSLILYAMPLARVGKPSAKWERIGNANVTILGYRLRGNDLFLLVNGLEGPVVARVSLRNPGVDGWGMMLQFAPSQRVTGMQAAADAIYLTVVSDGRASLVRLPYHSTKEILRAELPFQGSVSLYREDPRVDGALVMLSSWTRAPAIYRYHSKSDTVVRTGLWPSGPHDDPGNLIAKGVTVLASDGTLVPMTILYEKGSRRDGTHPTLLMGYGADASLLHPMFEPRWHVWLDRGGVLAFAHIGGGQYGGLARLDGLQVNLASRFQDFLACAQYLTDQGYTTPARLAAMSGGIGAILTGRAITAKPKLFRAAVIESGLLDPLGVANSASGGSLVRLFGNPKTLEGFRSLQSVSSYGHVKPGVRYPAVLLEGGMEDEQVPAWQSAKMAARLDADSSSGLPVLLNIHSGSGALAAGPAENREREKFADEISFLLWQLGAPGFQPPQSSRTTTSLQ